MPQSLRVLIVEDDLHDAELLVRGLRRAGYEPEWQRVETEPAYLAALDPQLDLVISDYAMPEFNGLRALDELKRRGLDVPFILVSATIGEETAVAAMKQGAADYLLKDRMKRLGAAVAHALEQRSLRHESRRADTALREAHAQLNHLVARSPTVIYQLKFAGGEVRPHFISENVMQLAGWAVAEVLEPAWWRDNLHPADAATAQAALATALCDGVSRSEYRVRHRDGHYLWIEDRKRLLSSPGSATGEIVGGWTDISVRKQAEETARENEARFRQVVENIHEVFWMVDVEQGRVLYVSPSYEVIWGRSCESLQAGAHCWLDTIHPEDGGRMGEAARTKQTQGTYDENYRILRPDGSVRWIRDRAYPVRDAAGNVHRVVGVAEDVTAQREMEAKFFRAQRLEAVGTLSSGLAHDLNNILAPMLMAAGLLRGELKDTRNRELIGMIESGAQRGANIIRQLLTFSRGIEGQRVSVQLRHLVREMAEIARETFPRNIRVEERCEREVPPVAGDATQLHQVLMNLCVNARDAMPDGGVLALHLEKVVLTAETLPPQADAKVGEFVLLSVTDNGQGIPPQIIERIFDPFFTTKGVGKGTGLGLSTVLGIVKSHGGFVAVRSRVNEGTVFDIYLPMADENTATSVRVLTSTPKRGQGELILLVDDEEAVREATMSSLESWGYRVAPAVNGQAGLAVYRERASTVRLAVIDLMMPVMGGPELAAALRAESPTLKIIAVTGMEPGAQRNELAALGVQEILMKPFLPQRLLEAIAVALADEPSA